MSCAEHHHPVHGGRSLPCFLGGTVALWLAFCPPVFPRVYKQRVITNLIVHPRARARGAPDVLARPPDGPIILPRLTGAPRDSSASTAASSRARRAPRPRRTCRSRPKPRGVSLASARARPTRASDAAFSAHRCAAVWSSAITRQNTVARRRGHAAASSAAPSDACSASSTAFSAALRSLTDDARRVAPGSRGRRGRVLRRRAVGSMRGAVHRRHDLGRAVPPAAGALRVLRAACSKSTPSLLSSLSSSSMVAAMACPQRCSLAPSFVDDRLCNQTHAGIMPCTRSW